MQCDKKVPTCNIEISLEPIIRFGQHFNTTHKNVGIELFLKISAKSKLTGKLHLFRCENEKMCDLPLNFESHRTRVRFIFELHITYILVISVKMI